MMAERPDIISVVDPQHGWLKSLYAAMMKARFPVRGAVLSDRTLQITVRPEHDPELTIIVRPLSAGVPGWNNTPNFVLGYDGARSLTPGQEKILSFCHKLLTRFDPHMDPELKGFSSVGLKEPSPAETLLKIFPFITIERSRAPTGGPAAESRYGDVSEVLLRTTARCNQSCPFCSAPQHDTPSAQSILACIDAVADLLPGAMLTLTGGEPTLRPTFFSEIERAVGHNGIGAVQVQTNACAFGASLDAEKLPKSDKLFFFVSLHALDPEIYDRCTGTAGQLPDAVEGIKKLMAAGQPVTLNAVVTSENIDHLDALVRQLKDTFPGDRLPTLHFSVLICPEYNPEAPNFLVRYSELVPVLESAANTATGLGHKMDSLLSSTHASVPPCVLGESYRQKGRHFTEIMAHETGYEDFSKPWVKAQTCAECTLDQWCLGVPRPYAERFGLSELKPIPDPASEPEPLPGGR